MKKHVRAVLDDLKKKTSKKQNQDLQNQVLSKDPKQKLRQLDYQAQKDEKRLS
jgi:hypothetical protein